MTPKQADRLINTGKSVTVRSIHFNETFTATFIKRDRWTIYGKTVDGGDHIGCWDRADLEIVTA